MSLLGGGLDGGLPYINRSPPPPPPPAALPPPLIPAEEFMFVLLSLPQTMGAPPSFNNGARLGGTDSRKRRQRLLAGIQLPSEGRRLATKWWRETEVVRP